FVESFCAALRIPAVNDDVVSLHVTKLPELVEQHVIMFQLFVCNEANPPHLARLLRARCERPRDRRAADQRDELAPFQLIELHPVPASQGRITGYRIASDQSAGNGRHGAMKPAGRVRCNIMAIAKDYSCVSQPFFIARLALWNTVGLPRGFTFL